MNYVSLTDKVVATRSGRSYEFTRGVPVDIQADELIDADLRMQAIVPSDEVDQAVLDALTGGTAPAGKKAKADA